MPQISVPCQSSLRYRLPVFSAWCFPPGQRSRGFPPDILNSLYINLRNICSRLLINIGGYFIAVSILICSASDPCHRQSSISVHPNFKIGECVTSKPSLFRASKWISISRVKVNKSLRGSSSAREIRRKTGNYPCRKEIKSLRVVQWGDPPRRPE